MTHDDWMLAFWAGIEAEVAAWMGQRPPDPVSAP